ncbi:MAG TPA: bifunctional methionine sulfoxide reductase B/A protein [Ignavibacteriales bacterium]|nr:bifunctional methionine sulfoxide reductase B/A protein [Ignavibacteriales bacterium]
MNFLVLTTLVITVFFIGIKYMFANNEDKWKQKLSPEQYRILREKGTEYPFTGKYLYSNEDGVYICAACGNELFKADSKFFSHCGWPSFDREIAKGKISYQKDYSHGMIRTEILCANCGGHLGHVFDDGPTETGQRYCVNSLSIEFIPETQNPKDSIILGGGCFWCIEAAFREIPGVIDVISGYSAGFVENPTYEQVCTGTTGHAEVVKITYDYKVIPLGKILELFFTIHDPTTLNRQGNDVGPQYRSIIIYNNDKQKQVIEQFIKDLNYRRIFNNKIVTQIEPFKNFYSAEEYHQRYFEKNPNQPYCQFVVKPKVEKVQKLKK